MLQASYTYKNTLGLFRYGQYLLFLTGLINLGLDILLGNIWGTFGILLATLIARMCTNLWYEPYAVFKYGLNKNPMLYFLQYCRYAIILLFTGAICWGLCNGQSRSVTARTAQRGWMSKHGVHRITLQNLIIITVSGVCAKRVWIRSQRQGGPAFVELPALDAPDTVASKNTAFDISAGISPVIRISNTKGISAEIFPGTSPEMICHIIEALGYAE